MRLLIVDDSTLVQEQIKNDLAETFIELEFEVASTGIEALEKQRRFNPDVVFLD